MNVKHPDGKRTIVMIAGSSNMAEIEEYKSHGDEKDFLFISIGGAGSSSCLLIDTEEWNAFVSLIKETDEVVQSLKQDIAK